MYLCKLQNEKTEIENRSETYRVVSISENSRSCSKF